MAKPRKPWTRRTPAGKSCGLGSIFVLDNTIVTQYAATRHEEPCPLSAEASQMNSVTRISRIRNLGVFRQFDWPPSLADFERYNLIYGWNWSGKTLLSRVFASLQRDRLPERADITVGLSGGGSLHR